MALYRAIAESLEASPGVPKADTIVNLVEPLRKTPTWSSWTASWRPVAISP